MSGIEEVKTAIEGKDKEVILASLISLQEAVVIDTELAAILTQPHVISELQEMLVEQMGVNPRAMRLNARVPNRQRRAYLFAQVMINGVNYLQ